MVKKTINSLYIHIPFCHHICFYCDFPKLLKIPFFVDKYINSLLKEIDEIHINHKLKTIYIGGGTPSAINLEKILLSLDKYIDINTEFTVEGNIIDFDESLLKLLKDHKVNRISIGVESMNNDILKILGRTHTSNDVKKIIPLIKKYIPNINVDLIYGLNELDDKTLLEELREYILLDVAHISTYALEIHKGTKFYLDNRKELDTSIIRKEFDFIYKYLSNHGYNRYEVSNFAKQGYESKHNITYWKDDMYYGVGLGAAGYIDNIRYKNTINIYEYIKGNYRDEIEKISIEDKKKYYLMNNLRLTLGIDLDEYKKKFNEDLYFSKKDVIDSLINRKLLKKDYTNLRTTYEGSMLLDIILRELF